MVLKIKVVAGKNKVSWGKLAGLVLANLTGIIALITFIMGQITEYRENKVNLNFVGKSENRYIFESEEAFPDAYLLIQGQVIIKSKSNVIMKTFIIDDMYEKKVHATENKIFEIICLECPLADAWMEKLCMELEKRLSANGHSLDEIVIEKIGLVAIWVESKNRKTWYPVYYIFEGESLTKIDKKTAKDKMKGVMVTETLLKEGEEKNTDIIMDEMIKKVLDELK